MANSYEEIHAKALRANSMAQGLLILIRDDSIEARNCADVLAENLEALTSEINIDLDSVNRP